MNSEHLCQAILAAESEAAVQSIVAGVPEMGQATNWNAIDNRETNFNVTSNQASDGGKALTELMTNMVDAILLKCAFSKGIDPKGPDAPKTMYEAVDQLVKHMQGGKLTNLDRRDDWLRTFATANLAIGVTGGTSKKTGLPCYTFADSGEGQSPERFPDTFLSLSAGNKKDIDFVQGKYNMGSSGVLGYCGRLGYKLIISRRFDKKHPWGWTLVRRRPSTGGMPVFEYFRPQKSIPSFEKKEIYPFHLKSGTEFADVVRQVGTIVKLFDYEIGSDFMGFRGSREALNENLVETILPFRIFDLRWKPDKKRSGPRALGVDERSFYGMEWLLLNTHSSTVVVSPDDDSESLEDDSDEDVADAERSISIAGVSHPELGDIRITGVVLKQGKLPQWLKPPKHINRIFHSVHGQVQFKQTRGALSDFGFPALKDRLVVFVDASGLNFEAQNGVWKADREHVNKNHWGQLYLDEIRQAIKDSDTLKELQQKVSKQELDSSATEKSVELFQKLVNSDKNLAALLSGTPPRISMQFVGSSGDKAGTGPKFEGKFSPTFVRFDPKLKARILDIPLNSKYPISASTDAADDYFDRADSPGALTISPDVAANFSVHNTLNAGRLTVFCKAIDEKVVVGQEFQLTIGLSDPGNAHIEPKDSCTIRISEARIKPVPRTQPEKSKPNSPSNVDPKQKGQAKPEPTLAIPQYQFLTSDGRPIEGEATKEWKEGTNENSGGYAEDIGEGLVKFYINYDNVYHLSEKKRQRTDTARQAITEKYKWGMLVLMLSLEQAYRSLPEPERESMSDSVDEIRKLGATAAAATVLTLAEILPKILDTSHLDVE